MSLSDAAAKVIDLAGKVRNYYSVELPKKYPDYPILVAEVAVPPSPPEEKKLRKFMKELPAETVFQLALLMYLGRGDYGVEELPGNYEALKETFGEPEAAARQMMDKAPLADYLSDGLAQLAEHGMDVNALPLSKPKASRR